MHIMNVHHIKNITLAGSYWRATGDPRVTDGTAFIYIYKQMGNASEYKTFNGQIGKGQGISAPSPPCSTPCVGGGVTWVTSATLRALSEAQLRGHSFERNVDTMQGGTQGYRCERNKRLITTASRRKPFSAAHFLNVTRITCCETFGISGSKQNKAKQKKPRQLNESRRVDAPASFGCLTIFTFQHELEPDKCK